MGQPYNVWVDTVKYNGQPLYYTVVSLNGYYLIVHHLISTIQGRTVKREDLVVE